MAKKRQRSFKCMKYELRSKFELEVAVDLINKGCSDWTYEEQAFIWLEKVVGTQCAECGSKQCYKERKYTPDFILPNGIIVEVKGNFTSKDRKIAAAMKEQHPNIDLRMVFQRDNKISRSSSTRYSDFCKKNNIKYAFKVVPEEWLKE